MSYHILHIARIVGGTFLNCDIRDDVVEHLLIDSRQLIFPEVTLFFAIKGTRHDGHDFLPGLYRRGVRNFIVSQELPAGEFPGANLIVVYNGVAALQGLAAAHRQQFDIPVIGITGSNGKTIIKEWLFQLLHEDYRVVRSPRSYNSQTGVPLSVWSTRPGHQLGIFEAGISRMGEMEKLAPVIRCNIGLFTNIGEAHQDGFPSVSEKVRQKLRLFRYSDILFYCRDHELIHREAEALEIKTFTWSDKKNAGLRITSAKPLEEKQECLISGVFQDEPMSIRIPFADPASIENAVHCWAILLYLGVGPADIESRMWKLEPVAMRLELKEGINGCTIINDSYNSDLNALNIALGFLQQQRQQARHTLILSDILQSGHSDEELYSRVAGLIEEKKISRFIGIGEAVRTVAGKLPPGIDAGFYASTEAFLAEFSADDFRNEAILLKGARPFGFEWIARRLAKKVHRTTLEVDLQALLHNLKVYSQYLKPSTKIMVMVNFCYGSGSVEVARLLEFHRVDYLAVAYADEGIELREGGVRLPILVLNPEEEVFDSMVRYELEPEIYSLSQFKQYLAFVSPLPGIFPVHLKIETGMHRLGFEASQLEELTGLLNASPQIRVRSVFSHLAGSEASSHDDFTHQQIKTFEDCCSQIEEDLGYRPLRHMLNSSGIVRFAAYQMDMVRLGLGIYGIDGSRLIQDQLQHVLTFKATISQIKELKAGDTVGYDRAGKVEADTRIATVSAGYADGLPLLAGNGRYALSVHGKETPIVGNVCMDMCMVDVTAVPEARPGDEVVIFGENLRVETLAETCRTIPYEILTGISGRVKRVYVQE